MGLLVVFRKILIEFFVGGWNGYEATGLGQFCLIFLKFIKAFNKEMSDKQLLTLLVVVFFLNFKIWIAFKIVVVLLRFPRAFL